MLPFALTIFIGAFLLFQVQPLIGKFILPWFGGSPAVWTTCMLFFQVFLLAGYAYAHVTGRLLKPRAQAVLHVVLLLAAAAMLPVVPSTYWKPVTAGDPTLRILALLTVCLGLPYFVLSSTGPLMQEWFRRLHPGVAPYRLYALSNVGSLLALISFPFVFEPAFTRKAQAEIWSWSFGAFILMCAVCAARLWRTNPVAIPAREPGEAPAEPSPALPPAGTLAMWFALPACASVLLLATTNKMCQDVAVIPFLWILPLSLYLLTFIICFDKPSWYRRGPLTLAMIPALIVVCWVLFRGIDLPLLVQIGTYLLVMFLCCFLCHGELYRLKPHPRHLTAFYLMIAGGGAVGGVLVAVIAPLIFKSYVELHWGLALFAFLLALVYARDNTVVTLRGLRVDAWRLATVGVVALGIALFVQMHLAARNMLSMSRNFYGVLRVLEHQPHLPKGHTLFLRLGEITHGLQFVDPVQARWPTSYFHETAGVGVAVRHLPAAEGRRIGVIGLGIGTLAAYGKPADYFRFYEINPEVARLAQTRFTYLSNCQARVDIVLGDARLSLENEPSQQFDLLAMDAFSNDAIPVHLLTREAFEIYRRHLKRHGVIAVNITNRYLNILPVVKNMAAEFGLDLAMICYYQDDDRWWLYPSTWVLMSANKEFLSQDAVTKAAKPLDENLPRVPLWTDDYASLFKILR